MNDRDRQICNIGFDLHPAFRARTTPDGRYAIDLDADLVQVADAQRLLVGQAFQDRPHDVFASAVEVQAYYHTGRGWIVVKLATADKIWQEDQVAGRIINLLNDDIIDITTALRGDGPFCRCKLITIPTQQTSAGLVAGKGDEVTGRGMWIAGDVAFQHLPARLFRYRHQRFGGADG